MLGELVNNVLSIVLGYAYPAFECFKAMESRQIDGGQLLFWCQYWVIIAIVTVFERFFDVFVSWLPLYGEGKLAFFIYLWHPKTMGTRWVYEAFLRPLVVTHEPDIEEKLQRFRARSGELLKFYIKYFTDQGQSMFMELLQLVISRPPSSSSRETNSRDNQHPPPPPPPSTYPTPSAPPHPITVRQSAAYQGPPPASDPDLMGFITPEDIRQDTAAREKLFPRPRHRHHK